MFGKRVRLFTLLGFEVRIDISWLIIAVLVSWSLASGVFPGRIGGLSAAAYWTMGVLGAIGLFASVIFHELSHSIVARRFGIPMKGITLFIFGGVAEMDDEPPSPDAELFMAIAGPAASIVAGFAFLGVTALGGGLGWPETVIGVLEYLGVINLVLAGFNLVPAFPLDGGRVLRALIWRRKKDVRAATRIASRVGSGFGMLLIFAGVFFILRGQFIGGLWWIFIGIFIRGASRSSLARMRMRFALGGEPVRRFMKPGPVVVGPDVTLADLVENYIYRYHFKMFPVVESGSLAGCVTTRDVKSIPREEWSSRSVGEVANACSGENTVEAETDAMTALRAMQRANTSRLMVTESGRLVGILALKDLLRYMSLKLDLEDGAVDELSG